jgi:ERCC4-type nuclease
MFEVMLMSSRLFLQVSIIINRISASFFQVIGIMSIIQMPSQHQAEYMTAMSSRLVPQILHIPKIITSFRLGYTSAPTVPQRYD